ncbi:MAG: RnfH family protein [Burkholderiales bacterium]|nr:MAG: RnfH family protein [Burkholderiales bacterium]
MAGDARDDGSSRITVEIVWVERDGKVAGREIELPAGSRIDDALVALKASGPGDALIEALAGGALVTAVYGERCRGADLLHAGDRIELLADLSVDPKLARRRRVETRRAQAPRGKRRAPD